MTSFLIPSIDLLSGQVATWADGQLVRHPGIPELNYVRPPSDSPCIQCHSTEQRLAYVSSQRLDRARGPWGTLAHPWWFDANAGADSTGSSDAKKR